VKSRLSNHRAKESGHHCGKQADPSQRSDCCSSFRMRRIAHPRCHPIRMKSSASEADHPLTIADHLPGGIQCACNITRHLLDRVVQCPKPLNSEPLFYLLDPDVVTSLTDDEVDSHWAEIGNPNAVIYLSNGKLELRLGLLWARMNHPIVYAAGGYPLSGLANRQSPSTGFQGRLFLASFRRFHELLVCPGRSLGDQTSISSAAGSPEGAVFSTRECTSTTVTTMATATHDTAMMKASRKPPARALTADSP
jgi:hypothetical protein